MSYLEWNVLSTTSSPHRYLQSFMENINFVAAKMEAAAASYREGQHRLTLTVVQNYDSAQ